MALASVPYLRLKLFQISCDCLFNRARGLRFGSLYDAVLHRLEERPLALCRCDRVRWLRSAILPSQRRIVKGYDVGALVVALLAPVDQQQIGDDLVLGVEYERQ